VGPGFRRGGFTLSRPWNIARPYAILGIGHFVLGRDDRGVDLLRQAGAADPRFWWLHLVLAGASGFKGDLVEAQSALAEAMKLKLEVNSLLQWHAHTPWATNPWYMVLAEPTLYAGLRRAGFPDE
jgi:hypothetical protein